MPDEFAVVAEQIRSHARNVEAVKGRFAAVKGASAHITQNDEAYGLLCKWIPAILEGRHTRQDELIAYVEENLALVTQALQTCASGYDTADTNAANRMRAIRKMTY